MIFLVRIFVFLLEDYYQNLDCLQVAEADLDVLSQIVRDEAKRQLREVRTRAEQQTHAERTELEQRYHKLLQEHMHCGVKIARLEAELAQFREFMEGYRSSLQ
jgi:vacuolar-type H+-ATPase subunit H